MPARHRLFRYRKKKSGSPRVLKYILPLFLIFLLFLLFRVPSKNWNGKDKLSLVVARSDGDVNVLVFDPKVGEISNIFIPGNTEVEVSRNLGIWKLRSVWTLGKKEDVGGKLLVQTITKQFKFPSYLWAGEEALGFTNDSITKLLKAVIFTRDTNLTLMDRIKIATFSLGVKNINKADWELAETPYLKSTTFLDGESGYSVGNQMPAKLSAVFSDVRFSENSLKVEIVDGTLSGSNVKVIGDILEILGGKVTSINHVAQEDLNCLVSGKDEEVIEKVRLIFDCELSQGQETSGFDLSVKIGEKFSKNF